LTAPEERSSCGKKESEDYLEYLGNAARALRRGQPLEFSFQFFGRAFEVAHVIVHKSNSTDIIVISATYAYGNNVTRGIFLASLIGLLFFRETFLLAEPPNVHLTCLVHVLMEGSFHLTQDLSVLTFNVDQEILTL
jgi:hypothetical protein